MSSWTSSTPTRQLAWSSEKKDLKKTDNDVMMRLSHYSARRPQEVQHLIHCCLAWNEYMPSVPIWPHAFLQFWLGQKVQLSKSSPAIHGGWWLNFQLMHVVTLADDDTNSILFMTEVSVKSRRMAVTSNCVNEKEFFFQLEPREKTRTYPIPCTRLKFL